MILWNPTALAVAFELNGVKYTAAPYSAVEPEVPTEDVESYGDTIGQSVRLATGRVGTRAVIRHAMFSY